jgi:hypothetical protein
VALALAVAVAVAAAVSAGAGPIAAAATPAASTPAASTPAASTPAAATPAASTPGPSTSPEYWFDRWQIPTIWAAGYRGQGITIAEIDTGVNANLPELAGSILPGTDLGAGGNGQIDREVNPFGHGTAMASIMVGRAGLLGITGIAPSAKVLPIAVPLVGTTDAASDDHLAEAIRYAADNGAKIISMSLGGERSPASDSEPCPTDEQSAIFYALSKGAVLLAASGNTGQSGNVVEEPGVCLGVVSVGAVDETNTVASFSSRHPYLTVTAPGVNIPSLGRVEGEAFSGNGTSQATAITSAVLALEWSKFPKLSGEQIVTRLLATLDRRTGGHDDAYGYGIVDALTALDAAVPATATNPVYAAAAPFAARAAAELSTTGRPTASPPPAGAARFGGVSIGSPPPVLATDVVRGTLLAGAGAIALLALLLLALVRRRRGTTSPTASGPADAVGPALGPEPVAGTVAAGGDAGLEWHDITGPPTPLLNTGDPTDDLPRR